MAKLAAELGIARWPGPSSGCALVHPEFGKRVRELVQLRPQAGRWEFELARFGHYRWLPEAVKLICGRNAAENAALAGIAAGAGAGQSVLLEPENFQGPSALIVGTAAPAALAEAAAEIARRSRRVPSDARLLVTDADGSRRRVSL